MNLIIGISVLLVLIILLAILGVFDKGSSDNNGNEETTTRYLKGEEY